jgi:hypothetical protein
MMKLSDNTIAILKNFSAINAGLAFTVGNKQKTIATDKSILAEATFPEKFEEFCIYDLNQFLGNLSVVDDPEVKFEKEKVIITAGDFTINYYACQKNLIVTPPDKELEMVKDVGFTLTSDAFKKMQTIASINNFPDLSFIGEKGVLYAVAHDKTMDTSNTSRYKIGEYQDKDFNVNFKVKNLKMLNQDYNVEIMLNGFTTFTSLDGNLKYYVAQEA